MLWSKQKKEEDVSLLYLCNVRPILDTLIEQIDTAINDHIIGKKTKVEALGAILAHSNEAKRQHDGLPIHVITKTEFNSLGMYGAIG